ncbi:MAG: DUF4386 domain-containing protein [Robiginitalea sp.]
MSPRKISTLSGIAYLLIFITGIYANFAVLEPLISWEDPGLTYQNLNESPGKFRNAVWAFALMLVFDFFLVWGLYRLFAHAGKKIALAASALRLINVLFFLIALLHLARVSDFLGQSTDAWDTPALTVMGLLKKFDVIWLAGLIFFGLHLLVLSRLVVKSAVTPRFIGILLAVAGIGYIIDSGAQWWLPNYEDLELYFSLLVIVPGVVGELSLTLFLLFYARRFDSTKT